MKRILLVAGLIIIITCAPHAQEASISKKVTFGFQLNQYQKDFGLGLSVTSPYFAHSRLAIRVRGNLMYLEHLKNENITWTPYSNISIGVVGVTAYISGFIKLYGEGGLITILPSSDFSNKDMVFGGYGLFGFEFYPWQKGCYFIELGGVGTGATADKVLSNPIYSNGFLISTGFRFHIK